MNNLKRLTHEVSFSMIELRESEGYVAVSRNQTQADYTPDTKVYVYIHRLKLSVKWT